MSNESRVVTQVADVSNCVVLIGGTQRLLQVTEQAATGASGARLVRADLKRAATICAEARPYAIVILQDVHDFCGPDLEALAKDVGAGLIVVPTTVPLPVLAALVMEEAAARLG